MNLSIHIVLLISGSILSGLCCDGQTKQQGSECTFFTDTILLKSIYKSGEQLPAPVGGLPELNKQLSKNLKFPQELDEASGKVLFAFVVEPDGKIDGERLVWSPFGRLYSLSKQFFQIIRSQEWRPGECNGKFVPMLYTIPINIDISDE